MAVCQELSEVIALYMRKSEPNPLLA